MKNKNIDDEVKDILSRPSTIQTGSRTRNIGLVS